MHLVTRHRCLALRLLMLLMMMVTILFLRVKATVDPTCKNLVDKNEFIRVFSSVGSSLILFTSSGMVFTDITTGSFDKAKNKLKLAVAAKPLDEVYPGLSKSLGGLIFDNYNDSYFVYQATYGGVYFGVLSYNVITKCTLEKDSAECFVLNGTLQDMLLSGMAVSPFEKTNKILVFDDKNDNKLCLSMRFVDASAKSNYSREPVVSKDNKVACRDGFKSTQITAMTTIRKKMYIFTKDGTVTIHMMPMQDPLTDNAPSNLGQETKIDITDFIECFDTEIIIDFWLSIHGICIMAGLIFLTTGCFVYCACKPKPANKKKKKSSKKKTKKDANNQKSAIPSAITQMTETFSSVFSKETVAKKPKKKKKKKRKKSSTNRKNRRIATIGSSTVLQHSPIVSTPSDHMSTTPLSINKHSSVILRNFFQEQQAKLKKLSAKVKKSALHQKKKQKSSLTTTVGSLSPMTIINLDHFREQQLKSIVTFKALDPIIKKQKLSKKRSATKVASKKASSSDIFHSALS